MTERDPTESESTASSSTEQVCDCSVCEAKRAACIPRVVPHDRVAQLPTTPTFVWEPNWVLIDNHWYWQRGATEIADYWRFVKHDYVCNQRVAIWEVCKYITCISRVRRMFLEFVAFLPEGKNPPNDFW